MLDVLLTQGDDPIDHALRLLDREGHFRELKQRVREVALEHRSAIVIVPAVEHDYPRQFAQRVADSEHGVFAGVQDLGGASWQPDGLDDVAAALADRLRSPRTIARPRSPPNPLRAGAVGDAPATPLEAFNAAIGARDGHFVFHQWFASMLLQRERDQRREAAFRSGLEQWLGFFAGRCRGPRSGMLLGLLLVERQESGRTAACEDVDRLLGSLGKGNPRVIRMPDLPPIYRDEVRDWLLKVTRHPPLSRWRHALDEAHAEIYGEETSMRLALVRRKLKSRTLLPGPTWSIAHASRRSR